jgi:hypothetical protein
MEKKIQNGSKPRLLRKKKPLLPRVDHGMRKDIDKITLCYAEMRAYSNSVKA